MTKAMSAETQREVAAALQSTVLAQSATQSTALARVAESQAALQAQVEALDVEMTRVSVIVEGLSLDPATSRHMHDARDSLQRSRTRLVSVRGRLGRLRGFEESQRLQPLAPLDTELVERGVSGVTGGEKQVNH